MATLRSLIERATAGEVSAAELQAAGRCHADGRQLPALRQSLRPALPDHQHAPRSRTSRSSRRCCEQGEASAASPTGSRKSMASVHELLVRLVAAINDLIGTPSEQKFADCRQLYDALERVLLSHFGYEEDSIGDALGYYGIGA
ncbi:MAG: hypothetical protein IPM01_28970 [Burkholderiaceae bacterium]|nr:hypothetical protein [Burkholderiaceae bacterium]